MNEITILDINKINDLEDLFQEVMELVKETLRESEFNNFEETVRNITEDAIRDLFEKKHSMYERISADYIEKTILVSFNGLNSEKMEHFYWYFTGVNLDDAIIEDIQEKVVESINEDLN